MGKQKFIIPTNSQIDSISKSEFVIPTSEDIKSFSSQKKNPNPSQSDMVSSGATSSMGGNQEEDSWYEKLYSGTVGFAKSLIDAAPGLTRGLARLNATGFSSGVGAPSMNIMAETRGEKVKQKTKEELLAGAAETVEDLIPYKKQQLAKGTSSISELYQKGYVTSGDAENVGYQLGDGLVQMGIGAIPGVGGVLLFSKNFEQRFEEAKAKGIPDDRAYGEGALGALFETAIEKNVGVDKWISKGLGKAVSKEAIKDISAALLTKEAFQETAKKYAKSLSLEGVKQGFKKGFLPEAIEEFGQTYIDGAEQDLFDYYERKRKQGDPNAKLALYDAKDEEGIFNTVNPETGQPELSPSFKSKTLLGALDASFYGGLTGQMGGMFVDSRSFNPSIYSTLQNSYDSQGKEGLMSAVEEVKKGLTKASESGKLEVDSYNNALKNVDKIANNVAKFEQNSDINSYSRYVLYDHTERIIPDASNRIARTLAEATTPLELPTQDQINDNINNGEVALIPFAQENQVPEAYKPYVEVKEDTAGNKFIEAAVPNSVVEAYNANQVAIQEAMNNPLFAIDSLTNNNKIVTIDDLKRIGQQGGIMGDLAQQLNFNIIFEANKNNFAKGLRVINYAKSISNSIAAGQNFESADLRKGYINIAAYNEGDTVFYNNKSAKVMEISPDGQNLKLSGIQDFVSANDNDLRLRDSLTEQAITEEVQQPTETMVEAPVEQAPIEQVLLAEEEQITGRTMRDAVGELIPFSYRGETGEIYTQSNGVVVFESPNRVYEFGNIKDIGDKSIDEFDIVPQEMSIGNDYSVTIDGKTFTNKNQNPFKAFTYDADGNVISAKLENDKGQTRVIKGTRAVVIEAKYKVKKLYDESTRDQLAAAAEDAANQAAAIEDTRGQLTETPTGTESKPVEQAPPIAERERINRVREIAERLAAEETEQMTQNRQAVANLASSLFTAGINVEVMNAEQIRIKYGNNTEQGMFMSKNGTIVLNESILPSEWGKTIIFHEGTHPIINIIRNTEPKLYKQLVDAIREESKTNPEVNQILVQIKNSPRYKDEFTRNDELVVEAIARVASGKLRLNDVKPTLRQAIVNFINKIAKAMGLRQVLKDSNQVAFNRLANQISSVLNEGRDIAEIVGAKNVGKFANENTQFRVNEVFEGILDELGISPKGESKNKVTNYGVASALNKYYNEKFNKLAVDDFSENALKIVSDYATDEVIFAMQKFGDKSGKGWYTEDFAAAVNKISEIYPAIKEKEDVREVANIIIAIASNSTDVSTNLMRVIYGLDSYQKTGKIPSDIGTGKAMSAIATTIDRYNRLLESFNGDPVQVKKFLQTIRPISESKKAIVEHLGVGSFAQVLKSDYATNPDWDDAQVLPTSILIFGPKIGAFYSNLSGLGGTPTIDRWCIRTMFRYRGDMRAKVLDVDLNKFIEANGLQGQAKASVLAVAEEHAKEFDRLLGGRGAYASLSKAERNAEMSKYRKGKEIYSKSADVVNDIKDGLTDEIKNKAQFAKDFRTFTKDTFQRVQDNILESTGEKLDISDIQAILWIYEKNLFGFLGVKQREDATYSAAANRIISSVNNGNVSLESVINGTAKLADMKLDGIVEEGAMGDQYIIDEQDFKAGIDANKGDVNIEAQFSEIDREYTMESTVADAGMTMAEREAWRNKNKVSQKQKRVPVVMQASRDLFNGDINFDQYVNIVRDNMPIMPFTNVPKLPSLKEIISSLNEDKLASGGIVGVNKTFADGERVASRLDIPAYENYDTWVVSIHDSAKERILGYGQTAVLKNVQFKTSVKGGLQIATNATFLNDMDKESKGKATIARIHGDWVNESPEAAHKRATELMNDPQWVQVGMNPFRHSFFYDKSTGEALTSAEEVIQVGALVLAKNPVRAPFGSQAFIDNFSYVNKLGEPIQFSDLSRDDKRIQTIRRDFATYPKADIVTALMGEPFNLSREKAEDLVKRAFADPLTPSLPIGNPDTSIPEGSRLNERSETVEKYNSGYDSFKEALLTNTVGRWQKAMRAIALEYDSKFFARRSLASVSSEESLAQAQLRNLNGIAYSASQDLAQIFEDIFGNGLNEAGIRNLDSLIFNLRVLQVDKNTENKYQDEIERLTVEFTETVGRIPNEKESIRIASEARNNVPVKFHGKTLDGKQATSQTASEFIKSLREELGDNNFDMLMTRANMFKKVGNEQVEKLRKAGIISNEVADSYKDDFYALRITLDRLYGNEDPSILMMNGVPAIKGWSALSKEGTQNYISQDSRLILAQSYIGTARAIAKNALRESIFNENINVDENGNQESARMLNGERVTFVKPAIYVKDKDGNIRSNGKELSVRDAEEGYVNVPFKKDGVINYFQMEAEMFKQIEGNNIKWKDAELSGVLAKAYYWTSDLANRMLTGFATRNNPFFWIGNVPMDLQQQIFFTDIWTEGNLAQSNVYVAGARAVARTIKFTDFFGRNKDYVDQIMAEYIAAGGAMDRMSTMTEQRQRSINIKVVDNTKGNTLKQILGKVKSGIKVGSTWMNEHTEIAMRLAAYDQSKKNLIKKFEEDNNGAKPNEAQMIKIQEIAAAKSRAYTDFAQRGISLPNANIAYLNSSIQAAGAAAEYIYDNPEKAAAKVGQLVVGKFVGTIAIMAIMGDAYDEIDEYRKDLYSFLYSFDTDKKDKDGNPIFVTADIRNNPSLVPVLGTTRRLAEKTMRMLQGKEQDDATVMGTIDEVITLLNQAMPIPIPNVTSIDGLKKSAYQLFTKHTLGNAIVKGMAGYDAFRNKNIISEKDKDLSPYMQGQDDSSIPYFYKGIAKSMSGFSSKNQVSPATMQAVAETFITSPRTNPWVGLVYMTLSDLANSIIPAKTDAERGNYSFADGSKIIKSITGRFATFTDAKKAEFRKNEELYIQSKEESMKYNDSERIIDNQLKDLKEKNPSEFFSKVDKLIQDEGYDESLALVGRIKAKAANLYKKDYRKSMVDEGIMNEVRILHYTQGAEGKAKLMNYMFEKDNEKANEVFNSLIYYGSSPAEVFEAKKMYNEMIKK